MREIYYYYRDPKNNSPVVTICLLQDVEKNIARGIALCSKKDRPIKKEGRLIAKRRALRALKRKEDSLFITTKRYPHFLLPPDFYRKSFYNNPLTSFEFKLFGVKKNV